MLLYLACCHGMLCAGIVGWQYALDCRILFYFDMPSAFRVSLRGGAILSLFDRPLYLVVFDHVLGLGLAG